MKQTVRVYLMTGGFVDVLCSGMQSNSGAHIFEGTPDEAGKTETVAKFYAAAVAGFLVLDTQVKTGEVK